MAYSPLRKLIILVLLWCAGLGAAAQFAKIAVPFALVQARYGDASSNIGWLLSIICVTGVLLGMSAGIFVLRLGLVRPLIGALLLGAVLSLRQAVLPGFPEMMVLRLIEGFSHLTIVIAAPTLIGLIAPSPWRATAMTWWSTFFGVAFALTAFLGLPLAERHGLDALLIGHALWMTGIALVLSLALWGYRPDLPPRPRLGISDLFALHRSAYGSAWIGAPAWGWLFYTTTFVAALAILPTLMPPETGPLTAAAMPLLSIAATLFILPAMLRIWPATRVAICGFLLAACLSFLGLFALSVSIFSLLLFAVLGLIQGSSFAAITQLNDATPDQALANGAIAQTGNLGNLVGTPLFLIILDQGGETALILTLMLLYLAGAATHVSLARKRARR